MPTNQFPPMSRRAFLTTTAASATFVVLHPFSAKASAGTAHLRIMETPALHVHIFPYDYYSDREIDTVGLARTAAHIADIRSEATNAILVDNGDFLQGNPMGDYIAYERGMKDGEEEGQERRPDHLEDSNQERCQEVQRRWRVLWRSRRCCARLDQGC